MSGEMLVHSNGVQRRSMEPWIKDSVEYYEHQVDGIRQLARWKSFILGDDMGLGKSLQALTVFGIDVIRGWASTMLVVCPVTLKGNWADEIDKFTSFTYVVLEGTPAQRDKQILEFVGLVGPKILIVNYEQVVAHRDVLDSMNFDIAVFDEAHYLQNPKSKRTKACLDVYSRRSFLLTGTPMLNHVQNLWTLMHRVDPVGFPNYYKFVNRYAVFGGYKNKQIIGVKNEDELRAKLQAIMLRRTKAEVLNLPPVQKTERRVDLTPEQRKLYDEVVKEMRLTRVDLAEPEDIENALTRFMRLKQICGTTYPFTGEDHSSKLDLAIEDAVELIENGHKIVVFTQFRPVQELFVQRLAKHDAPIWELHGDIKKEARQPIVKEWSQSMQPGALVCMIQIAGVGLNMTASRHALFLDKLFVPGLNQQAIDRLHRIGADETQPVQVFDYIARNTIENRINQIINTKSKLFGDLVETDPNWKRKLVELVLEEEANAA